MQASHQLKSEEIIARIPDLATLPTVVTKVISMMDFPGTTTGDIEKVINKDQVLTSKLLKLVNSSFYGFSRKIDSVADAIVLLGFSVLRNLIITSSIFDFGQTATDTVGAAIQKLWAHSVGCGIAAKVIAQKIEFSDANGAFSGGILHDIGKVMICQGLKKEFKEIIDLTAAEGISGLEAEERILGATHCDLGKSFAEKCNLPENLIEVIAHHHSPSTALTSKKLVAIVNIADIVNNSLGSECGWNSAVERIETYAIEILGLAGKTGEEFLAELRAELKDVHEYPSHLTT